MGYEAFYAPSGSDLRQSRSVTTTSTSVVLNGLSLSGASHDFFVVALTDAPNTLPSVPSEALTVEIGKRA